MKSRCLLVAVAWAAFAAVGATPTRILTIGNSFSLQMTWELPPVLQDLGISAEVTSMYIGGCSLERHVRNLRREATEPDFLPYEVRRLNQPARKGNVIETLKREKWDIVTIQQASHESWRADSFAFADELIAAIRAHAPQARIIVHETWSYNRADRRICGTNGHGPGTWGFDQDGMYERLHANYTNLAGRCGFDVIPTGTAVQRFRREFPDEPDVVGSPRCGNRFLGMSAEDTIHMNGVGNHLQALVWAARLFGADVTKCRYCPAGVEPRVARMCRRVAAETVRGGLDGGWLSRDFYAPAWAGFALDDVFGDHMVLQRRRPLRFSGCANSGSFVTVRLAGRSATAVATPDGRWVVELPPMEAGGPYDVRVEVAPKAGHAPEAHQVLRDVLIGEVWLASGQSNMEFWVLGRDMDKPRFYHLPEGEEVAATQDSLMRILYVARSTHPDAPCARLPAGAGWKRADTREANGCCSAVAWWFAHEMRQALNVPVGIVSAAWGGTLIQPWTSERMTRLAGVRRTEVEQIERAQTPNDYPVLSDRDGAAVDLRRKLKFDAWLRAFRASAPEKTAEALAHWADRDLPAAGWRSGTKREMNGYLTPGISWFRIAFDVPADWKGPACVHFDYLDDCDQTFLDGVRIGATDTDVPYYWSSPRDYRLADLKPGRHVLAIRLEDHISCGELGDTMYVMNDATKSRINLNDAAWSERVEFKADEKKLGPRPLPMAMDIVAGHQGCQTPATLFNAMIAPVTRMNIGGAIWYQGCSNSGDVEGYPRRQNELMADWRSQFRHFGMPFVLTQLAAFHSHHPNKRFADDFWKAHDRPADCVGYGYFRLCQDLCRTNGAAGVACAIDIGDHSDIHPSNKREVGRRLAHEALRLLGDKGRLPGPRAVSARAEGSAVIVDFADKGRGLALDGGVTRFHDHLFALAGADGVFQWADGERLPDGRVRVSCAKVPEPRRVQYCVSAYPPGVAFRRTEDGIPVYPFDLPVSAQ